MLGVDYPFYYEDYDSFLECVGRVCALGGDEYVNIVKKHYSPLMGADADLTFYEY